MEGSAKTLSVVLRILVGSFSEEGAVSGGSDHGRLPAKNADALHQGAARKSGGKPPHYKRRNLFTSTECPAPSPSLRSFGRSSRTRTY